ncbi:hypothetical protein D307_gp185 [Bacillus phage Bastille]|uniref:Uncharacterized protein n=6 Tax=Bastillevirus TaxID=1918010 RepID=A0A024B1K3_9CAUD|nr:hypothetical protein D307_gp185 [Bacillus phage Bastille]YP_009035341.1 hypothetical protein FP73_gp197 [Bacillus phage Hoody T]YP_009035670.1 hypothetical protein FP76_gp221 [Bacillus phage Evoli]YP_009037048.1 hypothetical protein FP74_gp214 [Bacillus phage CAM003]AMW61902.1 hypothetical protein DNAM5_158 [Bacillus phage Vinny]ASU00999.1 hypothetical protein ANTHONY_159 [Bacillus phage Anthony]AEQ34279.1 hypothetical protein [Bacillus phage Bastille]AHZ09582.1 hypothetical protein [Baci
MEQENLEGKELYYSLNGGFGAWLQVIMLVRCGMVDSLEDLEDKGIKMLEDINENMKELEAELNGEV